MNDLWKYSTVTNEWTWVSGDSGVNKPGSAGIYCEVNEAFHPSARTENRSCSKDSCGNIWMFGGSGINFGRMNDLWMYRPVQNDWSLIAGDLVPDEPGVFGVKGVPASTNEPGSRSGAVTWFDHDGNLWLFGGARGDYVNDLWRFTPDAACLASSPCIPAAINENNSQQNFSVYPNPSSGIFTVEIPSAENVVIEIRNVLSQLIFSSNEKNHSSNFKKQIDLSDQVSGIYFLQVNNESKQWVKKIFIE